MELSQVGFVGCAMHFACEMKILIDDFKCGTVRLGWLCATHLTCDEMFLSGEIFSWWWGLFVSAEVLTVEKWHLFWKWKAVIYENNKSGQYFVEK